MKFTISHASLDDLELLVRHRLNMHREIFPELEAQIQASEERTRDWIRAKMAEGKLFGFIAKTLEGRVAASGCIWLREQQPNPKSNNLEMPYLLSVFTEKAFRRTGAAKRIVEAAIEWCREHGYDRMSLHASDAGKGLYAGFGFEPTSEMRLQLQQKTVK
jgi:GNAT superfamily N-acetyltransferase